jgi:UDP-N-acetylglucosamine:LPS N-acetylglucosamine transferase
VLAHPAELDRLAAGARSLARPDATERLADLVAALGAPKGI